MSKRTVTMKSLIDENAQLRMRVHQLEAEIADYKARSAALRSCGAIGVSPPGWRWAGCSVGDSTV